ncbi:response regulator transcription factor [Ammoniphilus resinae]|uniref:YesN/AraC family two-component response regulator n=1 Tax=Ammoniphilus resinae TaxID=861532 RepID=A0ABS4GVL5_9BACL|nr:response regulator [Ammoniphilus resinae]MBP1934305.1 YesN/AraC family two-component response regulator [Ammoniphilus resinae]
MYQLLIADDEHWMREGIIATLDWEQLGFMIAGQAENGEEALQIMEQKNIHLLLVDIRMPKIDGLELMKKLSLKKNKLPYVIVISGYDDFSYAKQSLKLGASDYILKPVESDELYASVQSIVEQLKENGHYGFEETLPLEVQSSHSKVIDDAKNYILTHFSQELSLQKVADVVELHPTYFSTLFHQSMGYTFINFVTHVRIAKAKELLVHTHFSIKEIVQKVGYIEEKHFYRLFKKWEGMTPREYRERERKLQA